MANSIVEHVYGKICGISTSNQYLDNTAPGRQAEVYWNCSLYSMSFKIIQDSTIPATLLVCYMGRLTHTLDSFSIAVEPPQPKAACFQKAQGNPTEEPRGYLKYSWQICKNLNAYTNQNISPRFKWWKNQVEPDLVLGPQDDQSWLAVHLSHFSKLT